MVQEGEECGSRGEIKKYISSPLRLQDDPKTKSFGMKGRGLRPNLSVKSQFTQLAPLVDSLLKLQVFQLSRTIPLGTFIIAMTPL
ncbi:MAG: hypothetical protein WBA93_33110 [Microcoleaceae cyanobacterium]